MKISLVTILLLMVISTPYSAQSVISDDNKQEIQPLVYSTNSNYPTTTEYFPSIGESPFITNVLPNGDLENFNSNDLPTDWQSSGTGYSNISEYYTDINHTGNSVKIETQGYSSYFDAYLYQSYPNAFLSQTITSDYWIYLHMPDLQIGGAMYMQYSFYSQGLGQYKYLYYYLSFGSNTYISTNSSTYGNIKMNSTLDFWINPVRDMSSDFNAVFGAVGDFRIQNQYFYVTSPGMASDVSFAVFDDLFLENSTSFNFLINGDFESGSMNWSSNGYYAPAIFSSTTQSSSGQYALNITSKAIGAYNEVADASYSWYYYSSQQQKLIQPEASNFSIDWNFQNFGNDKFLENYYRISLSNTTFTAYLHFYITLDWAENSRTNSTYTNSGYYYFNSTNFNQNSTWNMDNIDLFEVANQLNLTNVALSAVDILSQYNGGAPNIHSQLLIDNINFLTYPGSDVSFEGDLDNNPNTVLDMWSNVNSYVSTSNDTVSGKSSMNITMDGSGNSYVSRSTDVKIPSNVFTYFRWKLLEFDELSSANAIFTLYFEGNYYLNYVLSYNPASNYFTNNSNDVYYFASDLNTKDSWNLLMRNVYSDLSSYFGIKLWNLTSIIMVVESNPSEKISILFDDLYFIADTHGPNVDEFSISDPQYYKQVEFRLNASDILSYPTTVEIYINQNETWTSYPMTSVGSVFEVSLPPASYGTQFLYYFRLLDSYGNENLDNNGGMYYNYMIGDDIDPILSVESPLNNSAVSDDITVEVLSFDAGSGVQRVELFINEVSIQNLTTSPFEHTIDTRTLENGTYTLKAISFDFNGNSFEEKISVVVDNDKSAPQIFDFVINPKQIEPDQSFTLYALVTDESEISSVKIHTKLNTEHWNVEEMDNNNGIYSYENEGIGEGDTLFLYIEATDEFDQIREKGSESNSLVIAIPSPNDSLIGGLVNDATELYENYTFIVGVATPIIGFMLIKTISFFRKRKK